MGVSIICIYLIFTYKGTKNISLPQLFRHFSYIELTLNKNNEFFEFILPLLRKEGSGVVDNGALGVVDYPCTSLVASLEIIFKIIFRILLRFLKIFVLIQLSQLALASVIIEERGERREERGECETSETMQR